MELHRRDRSSLTTGRLWRDVLDARASLDRLRHQQAVAKHAPGAVEAARSELVVALEVYAARLGTEGVPVPYRLRDELRLQSGLVAARLR